MKYILVGDPHVQVSNLEESSLLFEKVFEFASKKEVDKIVILGDCFHNHDVIRSQVMNFWIKTLTETATPVVIVTGNHDMPGSKELEGRVSALDAIGLIKGVTVVSRPTIIDGMGFIPYLHSSEEFSKELSSLYQKGCRTFFCHQTFNSARFENGFYAPHGVELDVLPDGVFVVSGHIHQSQMIDSGKSKVWYPGTPRWLTASDANSEKGVWLFDTVTRDTEFLDSSLFIQPFVKVYFNEGQEAPLFRNDRLERVYVHLTGSALWIKKQKTLLPEGVRVSSSVNEKSSVVDKTKRTEKADIYSFLKTYEPTLVTREELETFVKVDLGL